MIDTVISNLGFIGDIRHKIPSFTLVPGYILILMDLDSAQIHGDMIGILIILNLTRNHQITIPRAC